MVKIPTDTKCGNHYSYSSKVSSKLIKYYDQIKWLIDGQNTKIQTHIQQVIGIPIRNNINGFCFLYYKQKVGTNVEFNNKNNKIFWNEYIDGR